MEPRIVSFFVDRNEPRAKGVDYYALTAILQHSCDTLGLQHVVMTEPRTLSSKRWPRGVMGFPIEGLSPNLMKASCEAHFRYLETYPEIDNLFVGVDCIMRGLPSKFYPDEPDLCVTFRGKDHRYPINFGAMLVRKNRPRVLRLFKKVADRCDRYWCADQQAMIDLLSPMPDEPGTEERRGIKVGFLPMWPFNVCPSTVDVIDEPFEDVCTLHFRGKLPRKEQMIKWAERHL